MSKRCVAVAAALALLASLAFATPSQAGGGLVTTTISFNSATPGLTEIAMIYTGAGTMELVGGVTPPGSYTATFTGPNIVRLVFSPANAGPISVSFDFRSTQPFSGITATPTFAPSLVLLQNFSFVLTDPSVPEPSSMALMAIGMAGFFTFVRVFNRCAKA
jgi:hypothetical protein